MLWVNAKESMFFAINRHILSEPKYNCFMNIQLRIASIRSPSTEIKVSCTWPNPYFRFFLFGTGRNDQTAYQAIKHYKHSVLTPKRYRMLRKKKRDLPNSTKLTTKRALFLADSMRKTSFIVTNVPSKQTDNSSPNMYTSNKLPDRFTKINSPSLKCDRASNVRTLRLDNDGAVFIDPSSGIESLACTVHVRTPIARQRRRTCYSNVYTTITLVGQWNGRVLQTISRVWNPTAWHKQLHYDDGFRTSHRIFYLGANESQREFHRVLARVIALKDIKGSDVIGHQKTLRSALNYARGLLAVKSSRAFN